MPSTQIKAEQEATAREENKSVIWRYMFMKVPAKICHKPPTQLNTPFFDILTHTSAKQNVTTLDKNGPINYKDAFEGKSHKI